MIPSDERSDSSDDDNSPSQGDHSSNAYSTSSSFDSSDEGGDSESLEASRRKWLGRLKAWHNDEIEKFRASAKSRYGEQFVPFVVAEFERSIGRLYEFLCRGVYAGWEKANLCADEVVDAVMALPVGVLQTLQPLSWHENSPPFIFLWPLIRTTEGYFTPPTQPASVGSSREEDTDSDSDADPDADADN